MPATRLTMRKIREVLRLFFDCHLTKRQIATSCKIARSTVSEYLRRFAASGLSWPVSSETDDAKLEALLFPPVPVVMEHPRQPPDFVYIHRELRRKAVTLMLLWQEDKAGNPVFSNAWRRVSSTGASRSRSIVSVTDSRMKRGAEVSSMISKSGLTPASSGARAAM